MESSNDGIHMRNVSLPICCASCLMSNRFSVLCTRTSIENRCFTERVSSISPCQICETYLMTISTDSIINEHKGTQWSGHRSRTVAISLQHWFIFGWKAYHFCTRRWIDCINADWFNSLCCSCRCFYGKCEKCTSHLILSKCAKIFNILSLQMVRSAFKSVDQFDGFSTFVFEWLYQPNCSLFSSIQYTYSIWMNRYNRNHSNPFMVFLHAHIS